jgi:uncharacterized protein (TIGR02147 family)
MAGKLGMDHSLFIKVLLSKRHITAAAIPHIVKLCGLTGRHEKYFEAMVYFNKAKSDAQSKPFLERMMAQRSLSTKKVDAHQYEYYQKWYYSAVRSLMDTGDFSDDYQAIAVRLNPAITPAEARQAVKLLSSLGFIRRDEKGFWRVTDAHVTTGEKWRSLAVKSYQKETIALSAGSLERDPPETRDIASLTVSVDKECFDDIREMVRQTRAMIVKRVDEIGQQPRDRVYQLNIQLIPLSVPGRTKATEVRHE